VQANRPSRVPACRPADRFERDRPALAEQLGTVSWGREPLGTQRAVVLLLPGPARVDLLLVGHEQVPAQPWRVVAAETLPTIDHHFWQRILWLGS
jgi:hypothetical protein